MLQHHQAVRTRPVSNPRVSPRPRNSSSNFAAPATTGVDYCRSHALCCGTGYEKAQPTVERDCLRPQLRGEQRSVVYNARGIDNMRFPRDWRPTFNDGRLLVLPPFSATARRTTAEFAARRRNDLLAGLVRRVFIARTEPGSNAEAIFRKFVASGKRLLTRACPSNNNLIGRW